MAKRTTRRKAGTPVDEEAIAEVTTEPVDTFVYRSMTNYAEYTIEDRAIACEEDGLMPVQRRSVWAMYNDKKLTHRSAFYKHAGIIGDIMGMYHPHGDSSIHNANVRLTTGTPAPLIDGQGNWGSYSTKAAAMRYHEARTSKLTDLVYLDPYYMRAVEFVPTFDGKNREPVVLPAQLPMALAIQQSGIAVGVTTKIPAFSVESLRTVTQFMLGGGTLTDTYLARTLRFTSTWGGRVISKPDEIAEFFENGGGRITWVCDYAVDGNTIRITGIPPEFNFDQRLEKMADWPGVISAQNQADKNNPVCIVVTVKRDNAEAVIKQIIAKFLTVAITYRVNVVRRTLDSATIPHSVHSEFLGVTIRELLEDWLDWRLNTLERRALYAEEEVLKTRNAYLILMRTAIDHLDVIFKILRTPKIDKVDALSKQLSISADDARTIWQMAVGRLDRLNESDVIAEMASILSLRKQIRKDLQQLGASALRRSAIWNEDLANGKNSSQPRSAQGKEGTHNADQTRREVRRRGPREQASRKSPAKPTRAVRTRRANR